MITDKGKSIIGKYLLGQAPSYASYIAVGCGATPLADGDTPGDYSAKQSLDFEMFRVPISSRGFVDENGVSKIVLTAELPTEERYEITEIGIYSAGSNPSAASIDSRTIFGFSTSEQWQEHNPTTAFLIPQITERLDTDSDGVITGTYNDIEYPVFQANADNITFASADRPFERGRFYNNMILMRGDTSNLYLNEDGNFEIGQNSTHIHLTGIRTDFSRNSPTDEVRLAFSVVYKDPVSSAPENIRVMVEFADGDVSTQYARFETTVQDSPDNRYFVVNKQLQAMTFSPNFTWNAVNTVKIYSCVTSNLSIYNKSITSNVVTIETSDNHLLQTGDVVTIVDDSVTFGPYIDGSWTVTVTSPKTFTFTIDEDPAITLVLAGGGGAVVEKPSDSYYIALDAMRLENTSTQNPLYGLTGYAVVKNFEGETILKSPNTNNYIEFRFSLGVT